MKKTAGSAASQQSRRQAAKNFIDSLLRQAPTWIGGEGEHGDIIQSTRIRLARNLSSSPFPSAAGEIDLAAVVERVEEACGQIKQLKSATILHLESIDAIGAKVLVERRLISPMFAEVKHPALAVIDAGANLSIMVNEEDHLRIQNIQPGLALREAWRNISRIDDEISEHLDYAFSYDFGYLTACPTNTGTAMRASILVHLPALSLTNQVECLIRDLAPSEIAVRGFYGEGTEVIGNIFQISNQLTLGRTETAIVDRLEIVAGKFLEMEREARATILKQQRTFIEDKIYRAHAILQSARLMSSLEFMNHLSMVRLGVEFGLIPNLKPAVLNQLMVLTQPAHLQKMFPNSETSESRDVIRARFIREKIAGG